MVNHESDRYATKAVPVFIAASFVFCDPGLKHAMKMPVLSTGYCAKTPLE
jgi:hypothetical protein